MKILTRGIEGVLPDGTRAGVTVTAGTDTSGEVRQFLTEGGARALEHAYPGVRDVRPVGDWREYELPDPDDK